MNNCSPTGKDSAQLLWCLFPGNICKLCQSINKQNSLLFLSLVLVNATVRALPLLESSFPSAVRVWEMCQTSRAAAEQSPAIPVCFGTGGMHRSSEWLEEQGFEVCLVMLYYSWLSALWKIHCSEFSVLLQHTAFLEPGEGWWNTSGLLLLGLDSFIPFPLGME